MDMQEYKMQYFEENATIKQIVKNSFVRLIRGNRRKEKNVCKR